MSSYQGKSNAEEFVAPGVAEDIGLRFRHAFSCPSDFVDCFVENTSGVCDGCIFGYVLLCRTSSVEWATGPLWFNMGKGGRVGIFLTVSSRLHLKTLSSAKALVVVFWLIIGLAFKYVRSHGGFYFWILVFVQIRRDIRIQGKESG